MTLVQRRIEGEFRLQGLRLKRDALSLVGEFVAEQDDQSGAIGQVMDAVQKLSDIAGVLTRDMVEEALGSLLDEGHELNSPVQVVDAFSMPRYRYDTVLRKFVRHPKKPSIHGEASSKLELYRERFHILHQRVLRNKLFTPPAFETGLNDRQFCELTNVQSLIGLYKTTRYVLGKITQLDDGRFFLEDFSASVPIDISQAVCADGLYTENCIVIAEGELRHDNVFQVRALGFPPVEPREQSLLSDAGVDFLGVGGGAGGGGGAGPSPDDLVVVLSDVWLDSPQCMERLRAVLEGYSGLDTLPSMFVLMGNFTSEPLNLANKDFAGARAHFSALGDLLARHPRVLRESKVVLVPGPGDPGPGHVLPRPPLPEYFTQRIREVAPEVVLASNPCRVSHHGQEIVLMRMDLQHRMLRACVVPPTAGGGEAGGAGGDGGAGQLFEHLAATLLQQSHLCPLPLTAQPVYWEHDHGLSLYPLPDALVLGDRGTQAESHFGGVASFRPGSFAKDGSFVCYRPATREVEFSEA